MDACENCPWREDCLADPASPCYLDEDPYQEEA